MADGDVYDQHGQMWWKTCSRKLFNGDPTFLGSAIYAIKKMQRDGNLSVLAETAHLIVEVCRHEANGIDSRLIAETRLEQLERIHLDADSQTALRIAKDLTCRPAWVAMIGRMASEDQIVRVGQEILARVVVANSIGPELVRGLLSHANKERISAQQIQDIRDAAITMLCQSEHVKDRTVTTLNQGDGVKPEALSMNRPRASVDQHALVYAGLGG